jgi:hypothetical protein
MLGARILISAAIELRLCLDCQRSCALSQTLNALGCLPNAAVRDTQRMIDVATPERAKGITARWPDARRWGIEISALIPSGGEQG